MCIYKTHKEIRRLRRKKPKTLSSQALAVGHISNTILTVTDYKIAVIKCIKYSMG